ncbi:MAG: chemotaxis protein CheE [Brevundimonas sp.]|uniref:chemotaxis protein CheE n=1 Tax=Brevundimonas sp. TaxID=1871086 RepID=UPI001A241911|nr:chemotaxis protein CheE [Brevundimonas sp.]MBJ7448608.1 chemotaxis protein CheE [Brevundimonas sp.]
MTVITHARRKSNLSQMIDKPGGVSIGVALTQARANIEAKRAEAAGVVDAQIAALEAIAAPTSAAELAVRLEEVYHAANAVIDAASPFELDDLCKGAAGLCDVIDAAQPGQPFDWRIVTVHARSLRLLQTLPVEEVEARNQVLESLRQILLRKVAPKG